MPIFVDKLRELLPNTYIFVNSTFYNPGREVEQRKKDAVSRLVVKSLQDRGDKKIFFVDELLKKEETDGLVDGRHPNSYGFKVVAERLLAFISAKVPQM